MSIDTVGRELRALREEAGITRMEMSRQLGVREVNLQRYESGERGMPADLPQRYRRVLLTLTEQRYQAVRSKMLAEVLA